MLFAETVFRFSGQRSSRRILLNGFNSGRLRISVDGYEFQMDGSYHVLPLTAYYRLLLTGYLNTYRSRSSQQHKERKSNIEEEQHKETTTTTTTMSNHFEQSNESEDSNAFINPNVVVYMADEVLRAGLVVLKYTSKRIKRAYKCRSTCKHQST